MRRLRLVVCGFALILMAAGAVDAQPRQGGGSRGGGFGGFGGFGGGGGAGLAGLLQDENVRKELEIVDDQAEKVRD
ncbi:MAG: hypothetical protein N2C14_30455, partial [Planctomycetales bacterium]